MAAITAAEQKQSFFENNPAFQEIKGNDLHTTIGDFQDIEPEQHEIWLLQCPKGLDITQLQDQRLKLPGRSNLLDAELEAVAVESAEAEMQAFGYCNRKGRYALRLLPVRGCVTLRKRLKANDTPTEEQITASWQSVGRIRMPKVKLRHPLLGIAYERKVELDEDIAARLKAADENSSAVLREQISRPIAKIAHKKAKAQENGSILIEIGSDSDTNAITKKSKKKRKHSNSLVDTLESAQDTAVHKKKSKKSKKNLLNDVSDDLRWLQEI